jgi:hypothetical protein
MRLRAPQRAHDPPATTPRERERQSIGRDAAVGDQRGRGHNAACLRDYGELDEPRSATALSWSRPRAPARETTAHSRADVTNAPDPTVPVEEGQVAA